MFPYKLNKKAQRYMHLSFYLLKDSISGVMRMTFLPSLAEMLFHLRLILPRAP